MALWYKMDRLNGCRIEQTTQGIRVYRMAMVGGFNDPDNVHLSIWNAHNAVGLPAIGAAFPDRPAATMRTKFSLPLSPDLAMVTMVYEWQLLPSSYLKSYRAGLIEKTVNYDKDGNPAKIIFKFDGSAKEKPYTCDLRQFFPTSSLSVSKRETVDPEAVSVLIGGVNNATWRGYPARTWMFHEIAGSTEENVTYNNTYIFLHNQKTWDEFQVYRDETGRVPDKVAAVDFTGATTSGNGWKRFRVQPEINFATYFGWI